MKVKALQNLQNHPKNLKYIPELEQKIARKSVLFNISYKIQFFFADITICHQSILNFLSEDDANDPLRLNFLASQSRFMISVFSFLRPLALLSMLSMVECCSPRYRAICSELISYAPQNTTLHFWSIFIIIHLFPLSLFWIVWEKANHEIWCKFWVLKLAVRVTKILFKYCPLFPYTLGRSWPNFSKLEQ
jgi:hypothetical protein